MIQDRECWETDERPVGRDRVWLGMISKQCHGNIEKDDHLGAKSIEGRERRRGKCDEDLGATWSGRDWFRGTFESEGRYDSVVQVKVEVLNPTSAARACLRRKFRC